jgi:hypothetical protein
MTERTTKAARLDSGHGDRFLSGAGLVGCALALAGALGERPADPPVEATRIGRVESRLNTVRRRLDGTLVWNPIHRDESLFESDAVFADQGSAARLVLDDGSWIDVGPKTLVVVKRPRAGETQAPVSIELVRGSVDAGTGTAPMAIRSGAGSLVLDGSTRVSVRNDAGRDGAVQVISGAAELRASGGAVNLKPGEGARIGNAPPAAETHAIALASPAAAQHVRAGSPVEFRWEGASTNGPWQLEVARDAFFREPVLDVRAKHNAHSAALDPGVYHWRVRRGSETSEQRMLAVSEEMRPILFKPRAGDTLYQPAGKEPPVGFAWTVVPDAAAYVLDVRGEDGKTVLHTEVSRAAWTHAGGLAEGRHCARVRASASDAWSAESCFQVVAGARLPPPRLVEE